MLRGLVGSEMCIIERQEIEQRVYLLSPQNVEVSNELKSEISSKALFSWNK